MQQNKGYIIINGFLREEKFFSLYSALKQSADKAGLQLELKTNIELMCDIASGKTRCQRAFAAVCNILG